MHPKAPHSKAPAAANTWRAGGSLGDVEIGMGGGGGVEFGRARLLKDVVP
jgi:hypothetical protein